MADPVLVEVTRGGIVESRHHAAYVVADARGTILASQGDIDARIFPRSAVKAIQALPLVESGAADSFGFGDRELALAQASHSGEAEHVELAAAMLRAAGLSEADLECGPQWPTSGAAARARMAAGEGAAPICNNCSGKHAGFLAVAARLGVATEGYVASGHQVQQVVREAMEGVTGARHDAAHCATDGCSIPTYAVPLRSLAEGFARFGTGEGLPPARAAAARRLYAAATAEPLYVAGTGRFCTDAMKALAGRALVKTGAEGVFCGTVPERGLGIAVKCADGATRGSQAVMAAILARLFPQAEETLARWSRAPILSRRGAPVGEVRAVAEAFAAVV